jgi:hypothetical protein
MQILGYYSASGGYCKCHCILQQQPPECASLGNLSPFFISPRANYRAPASSLPPTRPTSPGHLLLLLLHHRIQAPSASCTSRIPSGLLPLRRHAGSRQMQILRAPTSSPLPRPDSVTSLSPAPPPRPLSLAPPPRRSLAEVAADPTTTRGGGRRARGWTSQSLRSSWIR